MPPARHRPRTTRNWPAAAILLAVATLALGCEPASQPPAAASPSEQWDVFYIGGTKVGHGRTTIETDGDGNRVTTAEHAMQMQRFGQTVKQEVTLVDTVTPTGEFISCYSKIESGTQPVTTHGEVEGNQLHLTTDSQGNSLRSSLKWNAAWGGYFASDRSLAEQPMKPGETRVVKGLAAIFNQLATTEMIAANYEETELLDGKLWLLLRIDQKTTIGRHVIPSTAWTNEAGEILKVFTPGIGQTVYRVSKERALRADSGGDFDLAEMSIVRLAEDLEDAHRTTAVTYRATLSNGNPAEVFARGTSQLVRSIDEHTAEITVLAVRPRQPEMPSEHDSPPVPADLAPNTLIQSDNAKIRAMAAAVLSDESDAWKVAAGLESFVKQAVASKNFSQAFATAAEVAESLEGDCTEHAVLLAALCRAREIPARVAIGLVYFPQANGFAYHMWTEAWIDDRWIPLDGTLGAGGIGGGHLKIAHSNLAGADAYGVFLPAQQVIGQLDLKVLSAK